ncbi:hypothetical protein TIFTF001_017188 [Ficus carica]|uniref:Uncharacterized protein n=1 Tax=Ficus carica TaxID=3494 RepID=A0AA88DAH7_FICCA|nr:hypothetical protein TIFTF001_017188 [Ficus carica]
MVDYSLYSPSINIQRSPLNQHIRARDVEVVPSAIVAFDVAAAGHVATSVPTSEVG